MIAARVGTKALLTGSLAGLAACAGSAPSDAPQVPKADYLSAEAVGWKDDLVRVRVALKGPDAADAVADFARCVAAGYAVKNNAGFVRQVRTLTDKEGGIWRGDAVYSVTAALPQGVQTIDAEVTVDECAERAIPTEGFAADGATSAEEKAA